MLLKLENEKEAEAKDEVKGEAKDEGEIGEEMKVVRRGGNRQDYRPLIF